MSEGITEVTGLLQEQGSAIETFKKASNDKLAELERFMKEISKKSNRPGVYSVPDGGYGVEDAERKAAFLSYLRSGRESGLEMKSMATDNDPNGGFLVPRQVDDLVSKALRELSPMRQVARVVKVESGDFSMLHSVGGTGYSWVGERSSRPETNSPSFREIKPEMGEIYSMPGVTQRLLDDSGFDLESWLIDELSEAFGEGEGNAFVLGDGINKPRGFLTHTVATTADGVRAEDSIQYVPSGAAGDFVASNPTDKLVKLIYSLKPRYRKNAVWIMNGTSLERVRTFKNDFGDYVWRSGIEAGQPSTLLGFPVLEDENMPDIATNSLSIAFGNFERAYTIVDRNSTMLRDPFTAKPNVLFYSTRRVGGGMRDYRALKLMKFAAS